MKTMLSFAILLFLMIPGYSQSENIKQSLKLIEDEWELDENNNLTYVRIIEDLGLNQDELYERALEYFTFTYVSGKSVIEIKDKENGKIIGKGYYSNVLPDIDVYHILQINVKDNRVRIVLTLTKYQYHNSYFGQSEERVISKEYPINKKGRNKTRLGEIFLQTHLHTIATLRKIEDGFINGNLSGVDDEW
ncbi:MAG: DUF4468 domain-containing protein [Bacteroidales bacterium]|nr:DUF4468 domain-containing protein [Bacteroidales bacterium]